MRQNNQTTSTPIWTFPWKFKESFLVLFAFIFIGFALEYFTNFELNGVAYPQNIIIISIYIGLIIISYFLLRKTLIFQWLKSPYLAIASISSVLFLVILMGSFTQDMPSNSALVNDLSLNRIAFSYPFLFVLFFFLTNLAFIIIYRCSKISLRNILFALNHLGLFISTIALMFSVGDVEKYTVRIDKTNLVYELGEAKRPLPFALQLIEFNIDFFPPKIAVVDNHLDEVVSGNGNILSADTDSIIEFNQYKIAIEQWLPKAVKYGDNYFFVNDIGYSPAVQCKITNAKGEESKPWLSSGSFMYPSEFYSLDSNYTVVMLESEAKTFQSRIKVLHQDKSEEIINLEVNKPINIKGWDIYQTDYDKEMGSWSGYSVVEMVYDPWLPVVYVGVAMLIVGAALLMFVGKTD
jgi:hypothetical protein